MVVGSSVIDKTRCALLLAAGGSNNIMIILIVIQLKISENLSYLFTSHLRCRAASVTVAPLHLSPTLQRWRFGSVSVVFVQSGSSKFAEKQFRI